MFSIALGEIAWSLWRAITSVTLGDATQVATILGAGGIIIAWNSYRSTISANRQSHMSGLFREYIKMGFDFHAADPTRDEQHPAYAYLADYKMWVLEEIWIWTNQHRLRAMFPKRKRLVENWHQTIIYQFHRDETEALWQDFVASRGCYHRDFVSFAEKWHPKAPDHPTSCETCEHKRKAKADASAIQPGGAAPI